MRLMNQDQAALRVVSLIPSGTEIVYALGMGDALVGRSHECDYPAEAASLPAVTRPLVPNAGGSRTIHDAIGEAWRARSGAGRALSIYEVDAAALDALRPDVIITQSQCAACAVSLTDVEAAVNEMVSSRPAIVSCEPNELEDIWSDIEKIAEVLGVAPAGRLKVEQLKGRMYAIANRTASCPDRPRTAMLEWLDPLMAAGNWMPRLLEMAGGEDALGGEGKSHWVEWDAVRAARPEAVLLMPCGFDLERTLTEAAAVASRPGWDDLPAVRGGRVFAVDGNQWFNRPGPRVVESLEALCEMLHPEAFNPVHEGVVWKRAAT